MVAYSPRLWLMAAGMAAQHRERQRADQLTRLHRCNRSDTPGTWPGIKENAPIVRGMLHRRRIKRERESMEKHLQHTLAAADFLVTRHGIKKSDYKGYRNLIIERLMVLQQPSNWGITSCFASGISKTIGPPRD
eukprot:923010-Pelagomonas_calceolata.AAC.1